MPSIRSGWEPCLGIHCVWNVKIVSTDLMSTEFRVNMISSPCSCKTMQKTEISIHLPQKWHFIYLHPWHLCPFHHRTGCGWSYWSRLKNHHSSKRNSSFNWELKWTWTLGKFWSMQVAESEIRTLIRFNFAAFLQLSMSHGVFFSSSWRTKWKGYERTIHFFQRKWMEMAYSGGSNQHDLSLPKTVLTCPSSQTSGLKKNMRHHVPMSLFSTLISTSAMHGMELLLPPGWNTIPIPSINYWTFLSLYSNYSNYYMQLLFSCNWVVECQSPKSRPKGGSFVVTWITKLSVNL